MDRVDDIERIDTSGVYVGCGARRSREVRRVVECARRGLGTSRGRCTFIGDGIVTTKQNN